MRQSTARTGHLFRMATEAVWLVSRIGQSPILVDGIRSTQDGHALSWASPRCDGVIRWAYLSSEHDTHFKATNLGAAIVWSLVCKSCAHCRWSFITLRGM